MARRRTKVSAVVMATCLAATGLAGCGPSEAGGNTLTWYINPDAGGQEEIAKRCSAQSGGQYTIETSILPRDASGQREQLIRRLAAGDESIDIMSLDPPFVPEFAEAGFLADVPADVEASVTQDVFPGVLESAKWKDKLVGAPFWANTQLLWYRKTVVQKAGLDMNQPVTWDQVIKAAESTNTTIGAQGIRAESLTVWLNALVEGAGTSIIQNPGSDAADVQLALDSEEGKAAAKVMGDVGKSKAAGPGFSTRDENASMLLFQGETGGFMVNWPFVWPATQEGVQKGTLQSSLLQDFGWAVYPQTVQGKDAAPPLGGIHLGVSSKSGKQDNAFKAIQCIVTPENQEYYFVSNGNPAAKSSVFESAQVKEKFPMAPELQESLEKAKPRPQSNYYNEISTGIQQSYHPPASVDPETTPQEATTLITEVLKGERLL